MDELAEDLITDEEDEEETSDGPNVDNFVTNPIMRVSPQASPGLQRLRDLVEENKQIIQERRDKMFGSEEEPTPEPEPVPQELVQGPKEKLPSINFTEKALDVLEKAPDLFTGLDELTKTYNSAEWDNPAEATKDLEDYGKALRQRFKISTLPEEYTFNLAPVKPSEIASEYDDPVDNTIDRTQKWKEANLKFLDETTDPQLIAKRDILKRSIIQQANKIEGDIRGRSRDEYYTGFAANIGLNAAKGFINPFYQLATGENYTALDPYLDPERADGFSTDVGMIGGGVAGFLGVAGASAVAGAPALAAGLVAGAAQGIGPVRERFNYIEDETGSSDQALTGALIEAGAQIAYNVPAGFLAGKAIKGTRSFLSQSAEELAEGAVKKEISEEGLRGAMRSAATREFTEGLVTGLGGAGAGTILTNESLRVGLQNNDISLFEGLDKSLIYGGLLGAGAGYLGGISAGKSAMVDYIVKNTENKPKSTPVDTALAAQEAAAKGKQADVDRATGNYKEYTTEDRSPDSTATSATTPRETVFGPSDRRKGKVIVTDENGVARIEDSNSPIPRPEEFRDLDLDDVADVRSEPDSLTNYDKSIDADDFVSTRTEGVVESADRASRGLNDLSDRVLIFSGKTFADVETAPGGLTLFKHILGTLFKTEAPIQELLKFMPQKIGIYGQAGTDFVNRPYVKVSKELFSDPIKFINTAAHEFGHVVDFLNSYINTLDPATNAQAFAMKPLINRLTQIKNYMSQPEGLDWKVQKKAEEQARQVSAAVRGEWRNLPENSDYRKYRDGNAEVFADVFSAWFLHPQLLSQFPDLQKAINDGFDRVGRTDPGLKRAYDWIKANRNNSNFVQEIRASSKANTRVAGFQKENIKNALAAEAKVPLYQQGVDFLKNTYIKLLDKTFQLQLDMRQIDSNFREYAEGLVEVIRRNPYVHDFIFEKINQPVVHLVDSFKSTMDALGIDVRRGINDAATLLEANKLINDSTAAIELIKSDPERFKRVMAPLLSSLDSKSSDLSIRPFLRKDYVGALEKAVAESDPEAFVNVMARMSFEAQLAGEELTAKTSRKKTKEAKKTRTNSQNILKVVKKVQRLFPEFKDDLATLFDPDSYRVRRYMANRDADVIFNANEDVANLKTVYGENFKVLENFTKDFYRIMATLDPYIAESGLYSPEVVAKMRVNKDSYVTNAVLDYFEGYSQFGPQIKAATGSLKNLIDPISATIAKKNAMIVASAYQASQNALVDFAVVAGYKVTDLKIRSPKEMFKTIAKLRRESPRDAFIVKYTDGKPALFQVEGGKTLEAATQSMEDGAAAGLFNLIESGNKLFMIRELRTAYSPAFVFLQKYRDRKREFLSVLSNETWNPVKAAKIVYDINYGKEGTQKATQNYFESEGRVIAEGEFARALENQVNPNPLYGYGAPERNFNMAIERVGELFGVAALEDNSVVARIHRTANRKLIESNVLGRTIKKGADYVKATAEQDEFRAKTNGYILARRAGMNEANSAHFARLGFGNPDPRGGGTAATQLNKIFLFGRAYLNGIRSMGLHLSTNPRQALATQFLYVVAPKLLVTSAAANMIGQLYGEEAGEIYEKWVQKVSSFDKQAKLMIPVGFQDSNGDLKLFGEVNAKDIGNNWKAVGFGIPQDPMETEVAKFAWPFIDETLNNWTGNLHQRSVDSVKNVATSMTGRLNPTLLWLYNTATFAMGGEPYDLYRNKGIYPKDIQLGGSFADKAKVFAGYQASQMAPNIIPFNNMVASSKDATSIFEDLQKVPITGPIQKAVLRISNFGEIEAAQQNKLINDSDKAALNLTLDDSTLQVKELSRRANALVAFYGKDREKEMNKTEIKNSKILLSWAKKFPTFASELRNAEEAGNEDLARRLRIQIQKMSDQTLAKLAEEPQ